MTSSIGGSSNKPIIGGTLHTSSDQIATTQASLNSNAGLDGSGPALNPSQAVTPVPLALNALNFVDTSHEASAVITTLRQRQYDLATEASLTANGAQHGRINTEISNISTEITRIKDAATYNAQNALAGGLISVRSETYGTQATVSTPDQTYLANALSLSTTTQSAALTTATTLDDVRLYTSRGNEGIASAHDHATNIYAATTEILSSSTVPKEQPLTVDQAEALAHKISGDVSSLFSEQNSAADVLLSNLDPERVRALLA